MGKKKKQRGSEQQTTRPISGIIIPSVGPKRAVTSQSLVPLRTAARTQSQTPLRLWAVQTLAEDSTPTFPAKPVPQYLNRKYSEIVWLPAGRSASTSTNADALTGLPNTYLEPAAAAACPGG